MSIKAADVLAKVIELADAHPDAVYDNGAACAYTYGEVYENDRVISIGCIIGQAILALDPDAHDYLTANDTQAVSELDNIEDENSEDGIWTLVKIQTAQDEGTSWGEAVRRALK